jgi:ribosome-binding protein aMBF1 (putative translation factor)
MMTCDLCGKTKDCLQKEIDGREYDLCADCWNPLAQKLRGKGRAKNREFVVLPPPSPVTQPEPEPPEPLPGEPPIIRGATGRGSVNRSH